MRLPIRIRVIRPRVQAPWAANCHYCSAPGCYAPAQGAVQRNGGDVEGRLTWWCDEHLEAAGVRIAVETNG